jgi:hypothetical protein
MPLISRRLQGWSHSVHTVAFKADGTFYVDLHNFDPDYGPGDYAWTVYVSPDALPALKSKVKQQPGVGLSQEEFLNILVGRFKSSTELVNWLEAEGVTFVRRFDAFAALDADSGP